MSSNSESVTKSIFQCSISVGINMMTIVNTVKWCTYEAVKEIIEHNPNSCSEPDLLCPGCVVARDLQRILMTHEAIGRACCQWSISRHHHQKN